MLAVPGEGFKKGHPYFPPKGDSQPGRKLSPANRLKKAFLAAEGRLPAILRVLDDVAKGKPIVCPACGHKIKHAVPDVNAAIYLVNKLSGLPIARHELSLAQQIELSGDDCQYLFNIAQQAALAARDIPEGIEGEYREIIEGEYKKLPDVHKVEGGNKDNAAQVTEASYDVHRLKGGNQNKAGI